MVLYGDNSLKLIPYTEHVNRYGVFLSGELL